MVNLKWSSRYSYSYPETVGFIAIGAAVAGLILWLNHLGVTASDILSAVGGAFGALAAFVTNCVYFVLNRFITFSDFLQNMFIDPVYAVKKLFYDLASDILEFISNAVKGIIDGINWLSSGANKIFGTNFKPLDNTWDFTKYLTEPTSSKDVVKTDHYDYLDYKDMAGKGSNMMKGFLNTMQNADPFNAAENTDNYTGMKDINKVSEVGKIGQIGSDINIAKEDLKYLLDATTQKYVNQINLTVQTEAPVINNNGTVREEADIFKVASTLATKLSEQKAVTAVNV